MTEEASDLDPERLEEVFELRLGGAELHDLRAYAARTRDEESGATLAPWNLSDRALCRYIAAADDLFASRFNCDPAHLIGRHLLQRRRLYAHCIEIGDFRTALSILRDEAKLEGLYSARPPAPPEMPVPTKRSALAGLAWNGDDP